MSEVKIEMDKASENDTLRLAQVSSTYINKFFINMQKEGTIKLFAVEAADNGHMVEIVPMVMAPASIIGLHNLLDSFIKNTIMPQRTEGEKK